MAGESVCEYSLVQEQVHPYNPPMQRKVQSPRCASILTFPKLYRS